MSRATPLWVAAALLLYAAAPLGAQEVLRGQLVDAAGRPLAGRDVVLHVVTEQGGAALTRASSDASGAFSLPLPADLEPRALVFAATQDNGRVYIGPAVSPGSVPTDYRLQIVEASAVDAMLGQNASADRSAAPAGNPPGRNWVALLVFLPLVAGAAGVFLYTRGDAGRQRRTLLLQLAELENAGAGDQAQRAALRSRLTETRG